jgi:hypothetical protein
MTPKELLDKSAFKLAKHVALLVNQYEEETGLSVRGIDVDRFHTREMGVVPQITIDSRVGTSYFLGLEKIRSGIDKRNES